MSSNYFDQIIKQQTEKISDLCNETFLRFQNKESGGITHKDFRLLLNELFTDAEKKEGSTPLDDGKSDEIYHFFNANSDDKIDSDEFKEMWNIFIVPVLKPTCALIVIDVQNDFIDGSLAIRNCPAGQEGSDVIPVINDVISTVPLKSVFYTYDWHPEDHVSFIDNVSLRKLHQSSSVHKPEEAKVYDTVVFEGSPPIEQKLWPKHCVQKSWGSELHTKLKIAEGAVFIYKGSSPEIDSYSAFWDNQKRSRTNLFDELQTRGITDVFVCGLAYDYCVGFTALHALEHGFRTILIEDACRGVAVNDITDMKEKLLSKHAVVVSSDNVQSMVNGHMRKWQLGYFIIQNKSKK